MSKYPFYDGVIVGLDVALLVLIVYLIYERFVSYNTFRRDQRIDALRDILERGREEQVCHEIEMAELQRANAADVNVSPVDSEDEEDVELQRFRSRSAYSKAGSESGVHDIIKTSRRHRKDMLRRTRSAGELGKDSPEGVDRMESDGHGEVRRILGEVCKGCELAHNAKYQDLRGNGRSDGWF